MNGQPTDPMTVMAEAAATMHELYLSLVEAGFTEMQALYMTAQIAAAQK